MNLDELINPSWKKQFDQLLKPNYLGLLESQSLKAIKEITEPRALAAIAIQESATKALDGMNNQADLAYISAQEALSKLAKNSLINLNLKVIDHFKTVTTPEALVNKALRELNKQNNLASMSDLIATDIKSLDRLTSFRVEELKRINESNDILKSSTMESLKRFNESKLATLNIFDSSIQMINQLQSLASVKALAGLHNTPFDRSITDFISENYLPIDSSLVISEEIIQMDHEIAEELTFCDDFNLLSDKTKNFLSYIYHEYLLPIILGCCAAAIMMNVDIAQKELSTVTTIQEVRSLTKQGSSSKKFNPSYLKGYRVTIASDLYFREEPSMKSDIITKLPIGTLVEVIDKSKRSWLLVDVEIDGEIEQGWVARRHTTYFK